MDTHWLPFLQRSRIDVTENLDQLDMLTDDATVATWNNQGLPNDRMSTENATILRNCERWPLMIDPQLQGIDDFLTQHFSLNNQTATHLKK